MAADLNITSFFGRFHPVLVHLPIGILLLAFLFELLSRTKRYKKLKVAVRPSLFYGLVSAALAAASGYYLSQEEAYDDRLLTQHKWLGIATVGLTLLVYLVSMNFFSLAKGDRRKAITLLFFPLVILLTLTGHKGGSLTHGEDYLFESNGDTLSESTAGKVLSRRLSITNVKEARVYNDIIMPLLEEKCYACHSSKKQKGQLRLDEISFIKKGGKHGEIFVSGDPGESEIVRRITLSIEEKEHMPPRREAQLTAVEIELVKWWIKEEASFDKKVSELPQSSELEGYMKTLASETVSKSWVPKKEIVAADESMIRKLRSSGISVVPVGTQSNYLSVGFLGKQKIDKQDIENLKSISPQLIELNLAWSSISDDELKIISDLKELRRLYLDHTNISDLGIAHLRTLQNLYYLNIVGTKVSDGVTDALKELKELTELYAFNTGITKAGIAQLNPQIKIDTGRYQLQRLVTDTLVFNAK
jgi:uncharacterized membrane protein